MSCVEFAGGLFLLPIPGAAIASALTTVIRPGTVAAPLVAAPSLCPRLPRIVISRTDVTPAIPNSRSRLHALFHRRRPRNRRFHRSHTDCPGRFQLVRLSAAVFLIGGLRRQALRTLRSVMCRQKVKSHVSLGSALDGSASNPEDSRKYRSACRLLAQSGHRLFALRGASTGTVYSRIRVCSR